MSPDLDFVEAMERAVGSGDVLAAANYLAQDVTYTVGAQPPVRGIAAVIAYAREQGARARLSDGVRVSLPCADFYRFADGRIHDWRVYADMSPIAGA